MSATTTLPVKDPRLSHPVATAWRPVFREVVRAFSNGDFRPSVPGVDAIDEQTSEQIKAYLKAYGERLVDLPDAVWDTSASQWMGEHWEVLVDLWTVESGRSDLVLSAGVAEDGAGFRFSITGVYVP